MRKLSRTSLTNKLDKIFSEYIRRRNGEMATCVTCGKKAHWKEMQAGHFISRKHRATRWDEDNVQVQCVGCNVYRYGEQYLFGLWLGKEKADELLVKSREICKLSNVEMLEKIEHYKGLVKAMD